MLKPPKTNAKVQRAYMLYEFDLFNRESFFRVDLTVERDGEAIGTPRPPAYLARLQSDKPLEVVIRDDSLLLRQYDCCFERLNEPTEETHRLVYNPYRPSTSDWKQLTNELIDYPGVLALEYRGETHKKDYEDFIA
jgi:hypothetical protein